MPEHAFDLLRLPSVGSTQDVAREHVRSGCPSGRVILAGEQTGGRGRRGRGWESAAGLGLWLTLIHRSRRPQAEWPVVTSAAALAVCRALEDRGLRPQARWPNDVLIGRRKVAGVLAETEGSAILIGIGVNILHQGKDFSPDLRATATSLRIECGRDELKPPDPEEILQELLTQLDAVLRCVETEGCAPIVAALWERSLVRDRRVTVRLDSVRDVCGQVVGLGPIGELCVRTESGIVVIPSGTLTRVEDP